MKRKFEDSESNSEVEELTFDKMLVRGHDCESRIKSLEAYLQSDKYKKNEKILSFYKDKESLKNAIFIDDPTLHDEIKYVREVFTEHKWEKDLLDKVNKDITLVNPEDKFKKLLQDTRDHHFRNYSNFNSNWKDLFKGKIKELEEKIIQEKRDAVLGSGKIRPFIWGNLSDKTFYRNKKGEEVLVPIKKMVDDMRDANSLTHKNFIEGKSDEKGLNHAVCRLVFIYSRLDWKMNCGKEKLVYQDVPLIITEDGLDKCLDVENSGEEEGIKLHSYGGSNSHSEDQICKALRNPYHLVSIVGLVKKKLQESGENPGLLKIKELVLTIHSTNSPCIKTNKQDKGKTHHDMFSGCSKKLYDMQMESGVGSFRQMLNDTIRANGFKSGKNLPRIFTIFGVGKDGVYRSTDDCNHHVITKDGDYYLEKKDELVKDAVNLRECADRNLIYLTSSKFEGYRDDNRSLYTRFCTSNTSGVDVNKLRLGNSCFFSSKDVSVSR